MSTDQSLASVSSALWCRCRYKSKISGWFNSFNDLYAAVIAIDRAIDQKHLSGSLEHQLDMVYQPLSKIHKFINDASFRVETPDTIGTALEKAANDLKASTEAMKLNPDGLGNIMSHDAVGRLLELARMLTSMSKGHPSMDDLVCVHHAFLEDDSDLSATPAEIATPPYYTLINLEGRCLTCFRSKKAGILERSIDHSFFMDDPHRVDIRVWDRKKPDRGKKESFANTSYFQATFVKADSEWRYTLTYSTAEAPGPQVASEQETEAWHGLLAKVPERLRTRLEKVAELHHDTLVMTEPGTESRLSALMPQSSSHEIYLNACRPVIALCNLLGKLHGFQTDSEGSGSVRTMSLSGKTD